MRKWAPPNPAKINVMRSTKERFNLHIGMPKTGTKTLQLHMFPEHPELDFLGTYIGCADTRHRQCRDTDVFEFMNELIWDNFENPDIKKCQRIYRQWASDAAQKEKILLWSWESLMENNHDIQRKRAENLKAVVGQAKITACLRHPVSLLKSLHIQLLRRDNLQKYARRGKPHRFESIEHWMARGWKRPGHPPNAHLEYAQTLQVFADVFGKDSIHILLFEQLVENQNQFVRDFCNILGIDPERGEFDRLKALNRSPLKAIRFCFSDRAERANMLGINPCVDSLVDGQKVQIEMSEKWLKKIYDKTRAGNRMIQEQWNVPLDQYGYPV